MSEERANIPKALKLPWGIFAAVLAMIWSFVTIGIVVGVILVTTGFGETFSVTKGLFDTGWLVALYVAEVVLIAGFVVCLVFRGKGKRALAQADKLAEAEQE